jgi:phage-related protein
MANEVKLLEEALSFLDKQPQKMQAKILRGIFLLEEFGSQLREPHVKKIKGVEGLFELRVKLATNICRLFFFHLDGQVYVVTSGFVKKENKTNPREIAKAVKLMNQVKGV